MRKIPVFSPADSQEAIEILTDTAMLLRTIAEYASVRRDLKIKIREQASECEGFAQRVMTENVIDPELAQGLDTLLGTTGSTYGELLQEALEAWISKVNKA